jgi:hypothetical protein
MYYEEAVIDGVLHWRGMPAGPWLPVTPENLTSKYLELRERVRVSEEDHSQKYDRTKSMIGAFFGKKDRRHEDR